MWSACKSPVDGEFLGWAYVALVFINQGNGMNSGMSPLVHLHKYIGLPALHENYKFNTDLSHSWHFILYLLPLQYWQIKKNFALNAIWSVTIDLRDHKNYGIGTFIGHLNLFLEIILSELLIGVLETHINSTFRIMIRKFLLYFPKSKNSTLILVIFIILVYHHLPTSHAAVIGVLLKVNGNVIIRLNFLETYTNIFRLFLLRRPSHPHTHR